ncbi:hypothetical protein BPO_1795 [Bergeyella porcorum]|uniref:Glycosyltransferase 2-like domain-containing protein n=1 Tax=Bergeyella porcorum TaxID=1735111 RepID=A0AAU0F312_9FLAO
MSLIELSPLISIIIPIYNAEAYLDETLASVFAQTYSNWECIIVNDGSTDNSLSIAKQWAEKDLRFKVFSQENAGVSAARNYGIDLAKGEYLVFIDSDDTTNPHYLNDFILILESNNTIIIQDFNRVNSIGKSTSNYLNLKNKIHKLGSTEYNHALFKGNPFNKLFSNKLIREFNIKFDEKLAYGEDEKFFHEYLYHIKYIKTLSCSNYNYFYRKNSAIEKKYDSDTYKNILLSLNKFIDSKITINNDNNIDLKKRYTLFFNLLINSIISNSYRHDEIKDIHKSIKFDKIRQKSKKFALITLLYRFKFYYLFVLLWKKNY